MNLQLEIRRCRRVCKDSPDMSRSDLQLCRYRCVRSGVFRRRVPKFDDGLLSKSERRMGNEGDVPRSKGIWLDVNFPFMSNLLKRSMVVGRSKVSRHA